MSKLSKRAISTLVIAVFMMSIFAVIPVNAAAIGIDTDFPPSGSSYEFGDTVKVIGTGVTSGALVNLYWDYAIPSGQMNSTLGAPDGTYEVWLDVPDATVGAHYVWVKDVGNNLVDSRMIMVTTLVKLSPSSGLPLDTVTVKGYGFSESEDVRVYFGTTGTITDTLIGNDVTTKFATSYPIIKGTETVTIVSSAVTGEVVTLSGTQPTQTGILSTVVKEDTVSLSCGVTVDDGAAPTSGTMAVTDDGAGNLVGPDITITIGVNDYTVSISGTIDYATGAISLTASVTGTGTPTVTIDSVTAGYEQDLSDYTIDYVLGFITFDVAPVTGASITIAYTYALPITVDVTVGTPSTDSLGSFTTTFKVPGDADRAPYLVTVYDESGVYDDFEFKVGAGISITPEEGPSGVIVTIDGRGFLRATGTETITVTVDDETAYRRDGTTTLLLGEGVTTFSEDWVIPATTSDGSKDLVVTGTVTDPVETTFEVTGLPEVVVSPTYGTPGSIITVKGYNFTQIAGTEVVIELWSKDPLIGFVAELVTAETNSDGAFEDSFMSPAVEFTTYDVVATDEYFIAEDDAFKVGLIALIINPVYGEAGTKVSITGIGFLADSSYNVTFGTILYEEFGTGVSSGEAISDPFYVPNVPTGTYDMIITDEDENEMTIEFRVTAVTGVTLDPAMAPNKYNVTIEGYNFADYVDTVEFILYNATDEWDMDVKQMWDVDGDPDTADEERAAKTNDDGNFTAYWFVLEDDTLSLGDYTINVTGCEDFFLQVPFSVVEARVSVAPRKALFDRGDTIQFNVKNDFDFIYSYMKIWDPFDNLYWQTELFGEWVKAGDIYTVPYYLQTSGMNPMELSQDAPLGTWTYVFYEEGTTQLMNGTFEVGPSAESLLTDQIAALSEELGIDIDTLRVYIDDLGIDMDEAVTMMAEDIAAAISGMEDDISGLSEDLDDAVTGMQDDISGMGNKMDSIESLVDDISGTSTAAQDAANEAKAAADASLEAAEKTQQQTSGLQGLVYGAIAASLIAALAAIVSLMQISRRIAG